MSFESSRLSAIHLSPGVRLDLADRGEDTVVLRRPVTNLPPALPFVPRSSAASVAGPVPRGTRTSVDESGGVWILRSAGNVLCGRSFATYGNEPAIRHW